MRYRRGTVWPKWVGDEPYFDQETYERAARVEAIRERVARRRRWMVTPPAGLEDRRGS